MWPSIEFGSPLDTNPSLPRNTSGTLQEFRNPQRRKPFNHSALSLLITRTRTGPDFAMPFRLRCAFLNRHAAQIGFVEFGDVGNEYVRLALGIARFDADGFLLQEAVHFSGNLDISDSSSLIPFQNGRALPLEWNSALLLAPARLPFSSAAQPFMDIIFHNFGNRRNRKSTQRTKAAGRSHGRLGVRIVGQRQRIGRAKPLLQNGDCIHATICTPVRSF
jgi:hypothetical protein